MIGIRKKTFIETDRKNIPFRWLIFVFNAKPWKPFNQKLIQLNWFRQNLARSHDVCWLKINGRKTIDCDLNWICKWFLTLQQHTLSYIGFLFCPPIFSTFKQDFTLAWEPPLRLSRPFAILRLTLIGRIWKICHMIIIISDYIKL